jgi:hypothetical protein
MMRHFPSLSRSGVLRLVAPAVFGVIVSASVSEAQRPVPVKPKENTTQQQQQQTSHEQIVPPSFYPPSGMCRIWINQVPAAQQPAPTDCASAVRNRPANGKVLFGDQPPTGKKNKADKGNSNPTDELIDLINRKISR